jgi:diguanylate cyclase (GGDEF)-like protein
MKRNVSKVNESPMMTDMGKEELYLYSLKKMAYENVARNRSTLTNLYGNKAFFFMANELMRDFPEQRHAVIRMDIYRFKTVNEFCGRSEGDGLLKHISDCFRKYESKSAVVGHLRADIFVLCTVFNEREDLIKIVEDINNKINKYPMQYKVLPAFGICIKEEGMDISLMCDYADLAIQEIKGKVYKLYSFYDNAMREKMLYEKRRENEISGALNNGDIKVYIQPKVDMVTKKIIGGEALVRWLHPQDGFLRPDMFVPVLERSGHIVEMDQFVWDKVFSSIRSWIDKGIKAVPISVNVSRIHVYQSNFIDVLNKMTEKYSIPPKYVPLEVTESAFTENARKLFGNIEILQEKGFYFSMDDFGSGYSSLNMLKDEPIDEVKIDRTFIRDMNDVKSKVVVRNIIHMLKELNIDIMAEGVETEEQAMLLTAYGCTRAQGYIFINQCHWKNLNNFLYVNRKGISCTSAYVML